MAQLGLTVHLNRNYDDALLQVTAALKAEGFGALTTAPEAGLLLPCNVTVSYVEDNVTEVGIVDPLSMMGLIRHPDLEPVAEEARARLDRVAAALMV